ncbi:MAG: hypothetical protein IT450_12865 [Phycisphaerales bacterium]|nr:hypothetical protein [Phycisphaerales bacterium]
MASVPEIEKAVRSLSPEDLAQFRAWFADFDGQAWDAEFEQDVAAGRLDRLAREAVSDLNDGKCTEL